MKTTPQVQNQSKGDLERELLKEQVAAARDERLRRTRPWYRNLTTVATVSGALVTPVTVAIWSIVIGAWRRPIEDAELKVREESFAARETLLQLKEVQLAERLSAYERRKLALELREEVPAYSSGLQRLVSGAPLSKYVEGVCRSYLRDPAGFKDVMFPTHSSGEWKRLLDETLKANRSREVVGPFDLFLESRQTAFVDLLAELLKTRTAMALRLAEVFVVEKAHGTLLLQNPVGLPRCPEVDGSADISTMANQFLAAQATHLMLAEQLYHESVQLERWVSDVLSRSDDGGLHTGLTPIDGIIGR